MQEVSPVVESDLIIVPNTHQPRRLYLDEYSQGRPSGRPCHFYYSNAAETHPNIVE